MVEEKRPTRWGASTYLPEQLAADGLYKKPEPKEWEGYRGPRDVTSLSLKKTYSCNS